MSPTGSASFIILGKEKYPVVNGRAFIPEEHVRHGESELVIVSGSISFPALKIEKTEKELCVRDEKNGALTLANSIILSLNERLCAAEDKIERLEEKIHTCGVLKF